MNLNHLRVDAAFLTFGHLNIPLHCQEPGLGRLAQEGRKVGRAIGGREAIGQHGRHRLVTKVHHVTRAALDGDDACGGGQAEVGDDIGVDVVVAAKPRSAAILVQAAETRAAVAIG